MKSTIVIALCLLCVARAGIADDGLWKCKVEAKAEWQEFDVVLKGGKSYLITANGAWTTAETTKKFGPSGGGATAGFGFFKVNKSFELGCLMANVRTTQYEIGSFKLVQPKYTGQLEMRMNDSATDDNVGSVSVIIEELSADVASRLERAFIVRPNLGKEDAGSGWQRSKFSLRKGQQLKLEFHGKWTTSFVTGAFGPEGGGLTEELGNADEYRYIKGVRVGALIGRFGRDGRPFAVDPEGKAEVTVTADTDGDLYFNINDTLQLDNGGAIVVVPAE